MIIFAYGNKFFFFFFFMWNESNMRNGIISLALEVSINIFFFI